MLSETMLEALNDQVQAEYHSSYIYLAMSAYFEAQNLGGFANWMRIQADEEIFHVMKFYTYINERGGEVKLQAIEAPPAEWDSPLAAFEAAYEHECYISDRINKLVTLAREEDDYATENFLQWFVAEQVEEEANTDEAVQMLRLADANPGALFMLNREFGGRAGMPSPGFAAGAGSAETAPGA